jgi:hypothetical protein
MQVSRSAYSTSSLVGAAVPKKIAEGRESARGIPADGPDVTVSISSFGARLSKATDSFVATSSKLSHDALGDKLRGTIAALNYTLTPENVAAKSKETPIPADAAALASAAAANAYVADLKGPNPFAGLSREQLSAITNDESGTFTTNERYAAHRQANDEEQAWRTRAVAAAMDEYHRTGKLTNFFQSALDHFGELPAAEQALYPKNYAADLQDKVDLDFNYFTHMPNGQPGKADVSLASLRSMIESEG